MTTTYTTNARVSSLLLYTDDDGAGSTARKVFSSTTNPTDDEVDDIINEAEDYIDEYAEYAWRTKTVTNEYHDFMSSFNRWGSYVDRAGYRIFEFQTKRKPLTSVTSLEAWKGQGSGWVDYVANHTLGEAMYEGDYWIDTEDSQIYFFNQFPRVGKKTFRITYTYGEATVPAAIRRVTNLLAGAMVNERYEMYMQVDKDTSPALNQAKNWRELAHKILDEFSIREVEVL